MCCIFKDKSRVVRLLSHSETVYEKRCIYLIPLEHIKSTAPEWIHVPSQQHFLVSITSVDQTAGWASGKPRYFPLIPRPWPKARIRKINIKVWSTLENTAPSMGPRRTAKRYLGPGITERGPFVGASSWSPQESVQGEGNRAWKLSCIILPTKFQKIPFKVCGEEGAKIRGDTEALYLTLQKKWKLVCNKTKKIKMVNIEQPKMRNVFVS